MKAVKNVFRKQKLENFVFQLLFSSFALLLTGCSLAGDVTPPPGIATQAALPVQPVSQGYPLERASAARGQATFVQRCAPCHGPQGNGDGEQASELPNPPAVLSDPQLARNASPAHWFEVVTDGNLEKFMPPFAEGLSESQRWDVVFYLYTLSASPEEMEQGLALYEANCAGCHGQGGKGDGPDAPAPPPDFTDQAFMVDRSQADFFGVMSKGLGEAMPNFSTALADAERWRIAAFLRTFTFDASLPAAAAGTQAAPALPTGTGTVTGLVSNGTAGGVVPASLAVVLHGFDSMQETLTLTTTLASDGSYRFPDVPLNPDRALIATVEYGGVTYASEIARAEGERTAFELPVRIFDATSDTSTLQIERLHILFEISEGRAKVGELYVLSNAGDKTVIAEEQGGPVTVFALPEGATDLSFQDGALGERYLQIPAGFADTSAVRPGAQSHQVLASFNLPYEARLDFSQPVNYPTGALTVLLPENSVELTSPQLQDQGIRQVQDGSFQNFAGASLQAGQAVQLTLSGRVTGSGQAGIGAGDGVELLIGAGALVLALAGVSLWWFRRAKGSSSRIAAAGELPAPVQGLIRAIASLDDDYAAGKLEEANYRRRRAELKRQALEQMTGDRQVDR